MHGVSEKKEANDNVGEDEKNGEQIQFTSRYDVFVEQDEAVLVEKLGDG